MAENKKISTEISEMIHSHAWQHVMTLFRERKEVWESQLLRNAKLDENERLAYIFMRGELRQVLNTVYEKAGIPLEDQLGLV